MNPKEFDWAEDQQVTVINPTKDDYRFKVHNKDYMVKAGQKAKMPGYIAWVYVYGLASIMAQNTNVQKIESGKVSDFQHWNEEGFRKTYFDKLVMEREEVVQTVEVEDEPLVDTFDDYSEEESQQDEAAAQPEAAPTTVAPMQPKKTAKKK